MDDPLKKAKEKAAATYDAAADPFDDELLSFWDRVGAALGQRGLSLSPGNLREMQ